MMPSPKSHELYFAKHHFLFQTMMFILKPMIWLWKTMVFLENNMVFLLRTISFLFQKSIIVKFLISYFLFPVSYFCFKHMGFLSHHGKNTMICQTLIITPRLIKEPQAKNQIGFAETCCILPNWKTYLDKKCIVSFLFATILSLKKACLSCKKNGSRENIIAPMINPFHHFIPLFSHKSWLFFYQNSELSSF